MKKHITTTGTGATAVRSTKDKVGATEDTVIKDALSQWVKLVREDCRVNCLQCEDHWLAAELAILFKTLAKQLPAHALSVINDSMREMKQSIEVTRAMSNL